MPRRTKLSMGGCQSVSNPIPHDSRHVMLAVRCDKDMRNSYGEEDLHVSFDLHLTNETPNINGSTTLGDHLEALNRNDRVSMKSDKNWRRKTMTTTTHGGSSSMGLVVEYRNK